MTRDEILIAAAQIFSEKGFHATSMQDIAQAVNLHVITSYSINYTKLYDRPLVSVGAQDATAVKVIQENECLSKQMMVGGYVPPEVNQRCIAISLSHVPKDLVVCPVLLDNVINMLNVITSYSIHYTKLYE